jgi:6-pyruvoyltetrahydropterin/6-carboxytetrahydropterin synthase
MEQPNVMRAVRYHDISSGHRVVGHENKCRHLHGHNYRIHFYCEAEHLDTVGRVIDFGVIKERLCFWVEENWDHKMLIWKDDPMLKLLRPGFISGDSAERDMHYSIVITPFNPTAENMAAYLINEIGPAALKGTGVQLVKVVIDETRKCSAEVEICDSERSSRARLGLVG